MPVLNQFATSPLDNVLPPQAAQYPLESVRLQNVHQPTLHPSILVALYRLDAMMTTHVPPMPVLILLVCPLLLFAIRPTLLVIQVSALMELVPFSLLHVKPNLDVFFLLVFLLQMLPLVDVT
jgi:hypothetical protein